MTGAPNQPRPSPRAVEEFRTQALRLQPGVAAERVWERVFTDQDRARLGGDLREAWQRYGTAGMWMHLRGVSLDRAVVDLALGIGFLDVSTRDWLLREIGELYADPPRTLDAAILQAKLVLIERLRQVFWDHEPIDIDWDKEAASWSFFWELCKKRKRSQTVTHFDLGEKMTASALSTRKDRLVNHPEFPDTLRAAIASKRDKGYWLDVSPQEIRMFLVEDDERIAEWTG